MTNEQYNTLRAQIKRVDSSLTLLVILLMASGWFTYLTIIELKELKQQVQTTCVEQTK